MMSILFVDGDISISKQTKYRYCSIFSANPYEIGAVNKEVWEASQTWKKFNKLQVYLA